MLVEEKKDYNGACGVIGHDDDDNELERRQQEKRPSSSSAKSTNDNSNPQVSAVANAPNANPATGTAHEHSDMQLDRPNEGALQHQQHVRNLTLPQPQQAVLGLNEMQALQLQQTNLLAAQQLLEQAVVAQQQQQQQQQKRFTQLSLNSLQLNAPGVILPSSFTTAPMHAVSPALTQLQQQVSLASQIQEQQALLEQAAALRSIGAGSVTSSHPTTATLDQYQLASSVLGVPSLTAGLFAPGAPIIAPTTVSNEMMVSPFFGPVNQQTTMAPLGLNPITAYPTQMAASDPIATAPLLSATTPSAAMNLASGSAVNPTQAGLIPNPNNPTRAMVPIPVPATSCHHPNIYPQTTIPRYIPPIPPTYTPQLPALSVQDRPLVPPIYNGINPNYPGAHLLHAHPPIFAVDNFLTPAECEFLIDAACDALGPAPVVGAGVGEVSPSRTSSTCYLAREDLPEYLRKVSLLTGKPPEHCELPQVGRYLPSQRYLQHFDAFDLSNEDGRRFAANGGQRTATVLVYLNDVPRGGSTAFPNLNLQVQPRRGMALVFFPSTLDGLLDKMALHAALPAVDVKYVSQVWIRQTNYAGQPSKRLGERMVGGLQERRDARVLMMQMEQEVLMQQQQLLAAQAAEGYRQMNS
mmetsp:Transcript_6760/g.15405  ORF Transcript_6760/g.15405 Transcript_6760/m.15405 type:complete len:636 (-) Transcript_6760:316-2223(-)|eukprot:CAMPEP_0172317032 /NCGR_PEP_ID=MMETSP1058-20130122/30331_1 /TAXON_ID=83371 /ORGANISM="Detonula confervacea, Strain CCMP 353" /LENGTH=635 /DNA_ID=CAMNT_0013031487 /DNA_START=39 /DNA_END=1946 /DNA_ORIENTATION=-